MGDGRVPRVSKYDKSGDGAGEREGERREGEGEGPLEKVGDAWIRGWCRAKREG